MQENRVEETDKQPHLQDVIDAGVIDVTIEGLGFQAEGWVRLADGWLSIRGALPGERVRARVDEQPTGSRRIWGQLVTVLEPVERRTDPHCDRARTCRGCQLRHVSMVDELAVKTGTISECVEKYANLPAEAQPTVETIAVAGATRADAFRVRSTLTVERREEAWRVGIRSGPDIVTMSDCPALADSTRRAISRFETALERAEIPDDVRFEAVRVAAPVHGHGYVEIEAEPLGVLEELFAELDATLPAGFGVASVDSTTGQRTHLRGPARFRLPLADLRLEVGFGDWFHATLAPAEVLYDAVSDWLDVSSGERLLDAGCGIGTIGLVCASHGADVTGFDSNPLSVETAELNAIANELEVRFECAGWERAFRDFAMARETFDTVVINPMRQPLGRRALAYVPRLEARRVLYLGPSPASAAKDLGILRELGYDVERLGAANLHPATYHAMLVGLLTR